MEALCKKHGARKYNAGSDEPIAGRLGQGSRLNPSLLDSKNGDQLVVITDGQEKMELVAFWRNEIPKGEMRQADSIPITFGQTGKKGMYQSNQF